MLFNPHEPAANDHLSSVVSFGTSTRHIFSQRLSLDLISPHFLRTGKGGHICFLRILRKVYSAKLLNAKVRSPWGTLLICADIPVVQKLLAFGRISFMLRRQRRSVKLALVSSRAASPNRSNIRRTIGQIEQQASFTHSQRDVPTKLTCPFQASLGCC